MRTKYTLLLCLIVNICFGQVTFQRTYGDTAYDEGHSVIPTSGGGYLVSGRTNTCSSCPWDLYVFKTNMYGDTSWTKRFIEPTTDIIHDMCATSDGGYVITGESQNMSSGNGPDLFLTKINSIGDTLWTKLMGGAAHESGNAVRQTADGGFIVLGQTNTFGAGSDDFYLVKTDANGDTTWTKTLGGAKPDEAYGVQQTGDGGYILVGTTNLFTTDSGDVYMVKTDIDGNALWSKTYRSRGNSVGYNVQITPDSGYIIAGTTGFLDPDATDVLLIRTDANGDTLWTKTYGGTADDWGYSIEPTAGGGYIIAGYTKSFGAGNEDVYLLRVDENGDTLWTKVYGSVNMDRAYSAKQTADGGFIVVGETYSFGATNGDVYLIKTDNMGNTGCYEGNTASVISYPAFTITGASTVVTSPADVVGPAAIVTGNGMIVNSLCITTGIPDSFNSKESSFSIFPNPANANCNITFTHSPLDNTASLIIYNTDGKEVMQYHLQQGSASEKLILPKLAAGVYVARLAGDGVEGSVKFVVE